MTLSRRARWNLAKLRFLAWCFHETTGGKVILAIHCANVFASLYWIATRELPGPVLVFIVLGFCASAFALGLYVGRPR